MSKERWFLMTKGLSRAQAEQAGTLIAITRDAVRLLDLVPYGGRDVRGLPRETYFVFRGDPAADNDWHLRPERDGNDSDWIPRDSLLT